MKDWLNKLYRNRYFLLFIMLFAYVQSIYVRISAWEEINAYTFTPEALFFALYQAGILFVIIRYFIRKWQKSDLFRPKEMLKIFGCSLLVYLLAMKLTGLLLALTFDTFDRNFNPKTFFFTLFSDFLNGLIFGSFYLAYHYYNRSRVHQQQLANYHQALADSRIDQLKAQLNPHFLFNNLNVLDQLIEDDKQQASDFLNEFADIYRYVLQASEKKIIGLQEELDFAERYFHLIRHKYGNAYQLRVEGGAGGGYIVPMTLQVLIENAVQHNLGTESAPVCISITVNGAIHVVNNRHPKPSGKKTQGRALNNLREQYRLLTDAPLEIVSSDNRFEVIVPIMQTEKIWFA
jgi:sensor histidine kinase YesM